MSLSSSTIPIPLGFYRLNLTQQNNYFTYKDLLSTNTATLTCSSQRSLCFKNDKAISCVNSNFWNTDQSCAATCDANFSPVYISKVDSSTNSLSGYCTSPCDGTTKNCNLNFNSYTCPANYTKLYLFCYLTTDETKGALFHNGLFQSTTFATATISPSMTNYHIELWYYPDRRFLPGSGSAFYAFMTNALKIKKLSVGNENDYQLNGTSNTSLGSNFTLKFANWYRLAFSVSQSGANYNYSFHYNKYNSSYQSQTTTDNLALSTITFCGTNCVASTGWYSGFYRWLRVYKGDFISVSTFQQMDLM